MAELDLDLAEPRLQHRRDLGLDRGIVEPIDRGGIGRHLLAPHAAEQAMDRLACLPPRDVPERDIDRCDRLDDLPARPPRKRRAHRLPQCAPIPSIAPDQARHQRVLGEACITGRAAPAQPLAEADRAVLGLDLDHDQLDRRIVALRGPLDLGERRPQRVDVNPGDAAGRHAAWPSRVVSLNDICLSDMLNSCQGTRHLSMITTGGF